MSRELTCYIGISDCKLLVTMHKNFGMNDRINMNICNGGFKYQSLTYANACQVIHSGVASLDLMLGHTFYNRPCLATGMLVHMCICGCCPKSAQHD